MDLLIIAAGRALASGEALVALNYIALRDDPPALALRGIAMAQLGDLARARLLLRRAATAFGSREAVARARCVAAEAEIALVSRDLGWPLKPLDGAYQVLQRHGDVGNATHVRYLQARYLLLTGRLDEAEKLLSDVDARALATASRAAMELIAAGVAMRRLRIGAAQASLVRARVLAQQTRIETLVAEVESAERALVEPAARAVVRGKEEVLRLGDIERLWASDAIVIDVCRQMIGCAGKAIPLETRPVLFALARTLAEAAPDGASRATLLKRAFGARQVDELHRARLRVEIGRLRGVLREIARIEATSHGFVLHALGARGLVVLAPLTDDGSAKVLALLGDGESWSSSALALALGTSQRTVQRDLDELHAAGKVQAIGKGRARRWMAPPVPGFPTSLLLPAVLANG